MAKILKTSKKKKGKEKKFKHIFCLLYTTAVIYITQTRCNTRNFLFTFIFPSPLNYLDYDVMALMTNELVSLAVSGS